MIREARPDITEEDIWGAVDGDEASIQNILSYYWPLIIRRATIIEEDGAGRLIKRIDEQIAKQEEEKIIQRIRQFRP